MAAGSALYILQNASTINEDMACICELRTIGLLDANFPYSLLVIPRSAHDLVLQLYILHQPVIFDHILEILPYLWRFGIVL